jgi:hypothetical protein
MKDRSANTTVINIILPAAATQGASSAIEEGDVSGMYVASAAPQLLR